ncbi:hypothetical protein Celaphus_00013875 [Cervus elaphus hippelaphus]|uniref:Uncharacterized protein n=1 Tax=Cervus elaphus hippelaphus TaxID=46360 RepID=A0A212CCT7_CEREH|nr:hypothetical protein Celaphus_00013875 [Cervus elaphus hippelaphus]
MVPEPASVREPEGQNSGWDRVGRVHEDVKEHKLIFYECSAYSGHNADESVLHLARILKEQEDTVREDTIQVDRPAKKKACCG